jgi:chromosome condensin MukBEF ATPase and DNA-binding subunit MukB
MTQLEREIGNLEARMETVEQELQAIRGDVREIRDALVRARGGWVVLVVMFSGAASIGALAGRLLHVAGGISP